MIGHRHALVVTPTSTRTAAQLTGDAAESLAARRLETAGWRVLGRNVRAGRSELDIVAIDPGPPARLVVVEVRWRGRADFGLPEETFDRRKRASIRTGLARLLAAGRIPGGSALPRLPAAVDLIVLAPAGPGEPPRMRHHRDVLERG
jgi:putative endonuclease